MGKMTVLQTLLFSIPEAVAITWLACSLMGLKVSWKKVFLIGLLMGAAAHIIRHFAASYVVNVFFYNAGLVVILTFFQMGDWFKRIIAVILSTIIYLIIEFFNIKLLQSIYHSNPAVVLENTTLQFLWFIPQLVVAFIIVFVIIRYQLSLFNKPQQLADQEWNHDQELL